MPTYCWLIYTMNWSFRQMKCIWKRRRRNMKNLALQWRHNDHDGVSNHQPHDCLLKRLFRHRSKKTSKLSVTGLCEGIHRWPVNSPHKGQQRRKCFDFMTPSRLKAKQQADSNTRTLVPEAEFTIVNVINARWQAMLITIPYNLSEIQGTT